MIQAGTIDTSFNIGGGFGNFVYTTVIQTDGKILVGGNFIEYDGNTTYYITRLNTDGSLDNTFDNGPYLNDYVRAIALESDGKILVGGAFNQYNGINTQAFVRLNSDGTLNTVYSNGFTCNSCNTSPYNGDVVVREITVQPDGKILVGGWFDTYNGTNTNYIVRLNYDGTIDTTFNIGTGFDNQVFSIVVLPNGNILVGGDFSSYNGITSNRIALLSPTGSLLNSFGNGFDDRVQKIVLQSDGKILIGGQFQNFNFTNSSYLIRLNSSFLIDTTFDFDSWVTNMLVQDDGRIIVIGQFNNYNGNNYNYIVRLNPSGSVDGSFNIGSGFGDYTNSISLLQNGNILIGGRFDDYDGNSYSKIILLNNDEQTYQYQYVYEAQGCDLTFGFVNHTLPTYYVGSDIELNDGDTVSIYDIDNPSNIQCATIISTTNIFAEPTHSHIQTYGDCIECLSNTASIAIVQPCNNDNPESSLPVYVSNLYQIGDIITIPNLFYSDEGGDWVYLYNDCYRITLIEPFDSPGSLPQPYVVEYAPKLSCEECTSCLGRYYFYNDCFSEGGGTLLSYQNLQDGETVFLNNKCVTIESAVPANQVQPVPLFIYEGFIQNAPVITSTVTFQDNGNSTGCEQCENALGNGLSWQNEIDGDGTINFLSQYEADILGPDDGAGNGWTYIKVQMPVSGSITFNYEYTTSDACASEPQYDWGFYYVGNDEPVGNNNIGFTIGDGATIFAWCDGSLSGQQTITFSAGQWVSIGVYSTDSSEGPGLLNILFEPFNLYTHNSYDFVSCNGEVGSVLLPLSARTLFHDVTSIPYTEITDNGLDPMFLDESDDTFIEIGFPEGFGARFLCTNYQSTFLSTNGILTFGGGQSNCCFGIPNGIPSEIGFPGVYISNAAGLDNITDGMDGVVFDWYSGVTDGGNKFIIRYEGTYFDPWDTGCEGDDSCPPFVFSFVFYSGITTYFDLVIQDNTIFYDNNPTGGLSDGINGGWIETFNSSSQRSYRISSDCPIFKTNYGTQESICGTIGDVLPTTAGGGSSNGGSIYFNGTPYNKVVVGNAGDFQFGNDGGNDLTIEWFQYWDSNASIGSPRPFMIGSYGVGGEPIIGLSFEGVVYLWLNGTNYDSGITNADLENAWHHIAITRQYDSGTGLKTWRVFLDGVLKSNYDNVADFSTNNVYLTIGDQYINDSTYAGWITNFRVNNLTALYISNFDVPPCPLENVANTQLLLLATDAPNLLTDSSSNNYTSTSNEGVSWSSESPCTSLPINLGQLFSDVSTTFESCEECNQVYGATLRECTTGELRYVNITQQDIDNILTNGPIFGTISTECYEMLDYCYLPHTELYHPYLFYGNCEICNQPFSAGTEVTICEEICDQSVINIVPPHPVWTNQYGKSVVQLGMVTLGGNGLNS